LDIDNGKSIDNAIFDKGKVEINAIDSITVDSSSLRLKIESGKVETSRYSIREKYIREILVKLSIIIIPPA